MGSSQSSHRENTSSFSVDPSGNITYGEKPPRTSSRSKGQNKIDSGGQLASQVIAPSKSVISDSELQTQSSTSPVTSSLGVSQGDDMASKKNELSLEEADEIVTRMKLKYKAKELVGKNKSLFEDFERDLIQCYRANKHQPTDCLDLTKQYSRFVEEYRTKTLRT